MMLEIRNLVVSYHEKKVLDGINLTVDSGEICTIIGPSGCGKSTLLKSVAGLVSPIQGDILFDGDAISQRQHTIGLIPQNYGLLPWKTVAQNIALSLKIKQRELSKLEVDLAVEKMLDRIGLLSYKKKYPNMLSGGQQQRVAIARAFVLQPNILLMDEPFSALDSLTKEGMWGFFLEILKHSKASTLFITHDVQEAVFLGTKVVIMAPGRVVDVIDSPSVDLESDEFMQLCTYVRQVMQRGE